MAGRALRARLSQVVKTHRLDNFFANNDFLDSFFHNNNDNGGGGIEQSVEQETQSGDVSLGYSVTNSGDYASQCTPAIQFATPATSKTPPASCSTEARPTTSSRVA